ncbi:MAG TPA: glycosyltransferase family 2 protein [Patescibacteria group bacterium]|nr:glycosyltransferase family 2 protein [Patescibacteria group bacterium]
MAIELSIIILNYKSRGLVRQCVKGIKKFPPKVSFEIIVVDNHSEDGVGMMLAERYPEVKIVASSLNGGFGSGMNLGIAKSAGKYLLLLNPDIVVFDGSIQRLYEFMEANPSAAIAGPQLLNPDGTVQLSCFRFHSLLTPLYRRTPLGNLPFAKAHLAQFLMKDDFHNRNRAVEWILGACMMIRKSALDAIGLFDERFFLYFEDTDLCRRAWEKGFKVIYVADAQMAHYHKRESAEYSGFGGLFSYPTRVHITSWIKYLLKYQKKPVPNISEL